METILICVAIYLISMMITGSIHWAQYQDAMAAKENVSTEDKVLKLYISPFCPILNTVMAFMIIMNYLN
jgi:transposase